MLLTTTDHIFPSSTVQIISQQGLLDNTRFPHRCGAGWVECFWRQCLYMDVKLDVILPEPEDGEVTLEEIVPDFPELEERPEDSSW